MNRNTEQKNSRGNQRFNIADVVIIIVIIAITAALGLRIYNIFGTEKDLCRVEVTFRADCISEGSISLAEKAKLYYTETNAEVGYIKEFAVSDMIQHAYDENGKLVEATVPGKKTVTGKIVLYCEKTDKGYYLDGTKFLTVGEKVSLYTTTREMLFSVLSIKEIIETTSGSTSSTTQAAIQ